MLYSSTASWTHWQSEGVGMSASMRTCSAGAYEQAVAVEWLEWQECHKTGCVLRHELLPMS